MAHTNGVLLLAWCLICVWCNDMVEGQTIKADTTTTDFFNPFAWIGNAFPVTNAANVIINAARTVTLSISWAAISFTLDLGQFSLADKTFTATNFLFSSGKLTMTTGKFISLGTTNIPAASTHQLITGGKLDMPTPILAKFELATNAGLDISGSDIQGGVFNLADGAILNFISTGNTFSDDSTVTATSSSSTSTAGVVQHTGATSVTNGVTTVDAVQYVTSTGSLTTGADAGQMQAKRDIIVGGGGVIGGKAGSTLLSHSFDSQATSGSTLVIGGGSSAAVLRFRGSKLQSSSAPFNSQSMTNDNHNDGTIAKNPFAPSSVPSGASTLNGGTIELLADARIVLERSAKVYVTRDTRIRTYQQASAGPSNGFRVMTDILPPLYIGDGSGITIDSGDLTVLPSTTVDDGGSVTIGAGRRLRSGGLVMGTNSSITFSASPTNGFTTQIITGNAILAGGAAIIELSTYVANTTVTLLTTDDGVISGSFGKVSITRNGVPVDNAAAGTLSYQSQQVTFTPIGESLPTGATTGSLGSSGEPISQGSTATTGAISAAYHSYISLSSSFIMATVMIVVIMITMH